MFVWQKSGVVRIYKDGALLPTPFLDISDHVNNDHDRGMLGSRPRSRSSTPTATSISSYIYEEGGNPARRAVLRQAGSLASRPIPRTPTVPCPAARPSSSARSARRPAAAQPAGADCIGFDIDSHSAGTLRFAPDGTLFLSFGDGAAYMQADPLALRAQSLDRYERARSCGSSPDGTAPPDNPFYDGTNSNRSEGLLLRPAQPVPLRARADERRARRGRRRLERSCEEVDFGQRQELRLALLRGRAGSAPSTRRSRRRVRVVPASRRHLRRLYLRSTPSARPRSAVVVYDALVYPAGLPQAPTSSADYSADWLRYGQLDASGVLQNVQLFGTSMGGIGRPRSWGPTARSTTWPSTSARCGGFASRWRSRQAPMASAKPASGYSPLAVQFSSVGSSEPRRHAALVPLELRRRDHVDGGESLAHLHRERASSRSRPQFTVITTRQSVSASASVRGSWSAAGRQSARITRPARRSSRCTPATR